MKIYTKTGDKGKTSLLAGGRVSKANPRIEAYGTIDELNSFVGTLHSAISVEGNLKTDDKNEMCATLANIQVALFNAGAIMACEKEPAFELSGIKISEIEYLEYEMDKMNEDLPELKNFILPSGSISGTAAHVCRSVCRRAERRCIAISQTSENENQVIIYLNRLSDYFFVLARKINKLTNANETIWLP